jgi:flagellar hook protein FlgE
MGTTINLDANATPIAAASQTAANAITTSMDVYDSLGAKHNISVNFWPNGSNSWNWQATIPGADVGVTTGPVAMGSGTLSFNSSGQLTSPTTSPTLSASGLANGAQNLSVKFDLFGGGTKPVVTQLATATNFGNPQQNGYGASALTEIGIGDGGQIIGTYADSQKVVLGQLAMANFVNPDTLIAVGNNQYQVSGATSNAAIGAAGTGGRGDLIGGSLESSTVDIATEFTTLMVSQRAYQANSKVITTADQINQDTINLIR